MRNFLGVYKYAPTAGMEGDLGWVKPLIRRKIEILRFWNRIVSLDESRLPRQIYNEMLLKGHPWISNVKEIFDSINATDAFVNFKQFSIYVNNAYFADIWSETIRSKPKHDLYRQHKLYIKEENYCKVMLKRSQRSLIARLRLGIFPINLELGRYNNIPREERWCPVCPNKVVENEFHVLFFCPLYASERFTLMEHANNINVNFKNYLHVEQFEFLTTNNIILRKTKFLQVLVT